ncbi:MAG: IS66 family transposase [Gemmatales bacterium]
MSKDVLPPDPLSLPEDVALLKAMIVELQQAQQRSQRTIDGLQQRLEQLLKRLYGPRGEKFDPQAYALFPELKALLDQPAPPLAQPVQEAGATPKKSSTGRRQLPSSLRREQHRYELPEDQRQCPNCHVTCEPFSEEVTEQLDYIPANLFVHEHIRCKYACPQCKSHVVTAPKPAQPIDKGLPAAGLIAHVAVCKYSDHVPLHRQEQIFARHGLELPRSTTCDWMASAAELLKPLYDEMIKEILQSRLLHTDDTRVSMQDKATPGKTTSTRFWTYVGDDEHPLTVFDFTLSRQRDGPASFLKGYSGAIQADGYSAYDGIALSGNNPRGGCWAHARRHFHDTEKTAPPMYYAEVMARIGRLFAIERDIKERLESMTEQQGHPVVGTAADAVRLEVRQLRTIPELETLRHFLDEQKKDALPKSPWGQAVNYALNQWDDLCLFTTLGCLAIDNNIAERSLRGIALGRRNWLFVGSPQGGQTAAILFSVLASCKRHEVEPWAYLRDVLQRLALPATPEELRQLFPHRWKPNPGTK